MTQAQDNSEHDEKVSALESLAAGDDPAGETSVEDTPTTSDAPAIDLSQEPPDPAAALDGLEGAFEPLAQTGEQVGIVGQAASGPQTAAAARVRAARLHQQTKRAHAMQFRQILIPVLIGVAIVLMILGTVVLAKDPPTQAAGDASDHDWLRDPTVWNSFGIIAFPMGAILLFGAWMFHKDVQRLKQQR